MTERRRRCFGTDDPVRPEIAPFISPPRLSHPENAFSTRDAALVSNSKSAPEQNQATRNWLHRNWPTGHCGFATLPPSFLLCLSNLFGLVLLGSCFLSQVHRPRIPYCRESSRMPRGSRFKARISGLKRQTTADCSRRLKRM